MFINVVNLLATSSELDDLLAQNRRLRASFENVLILGANYKFSYSRRSPDNKDRSFYYAGGVEVAGNGLYLATEATGQKSSREILSIPFSQYLKVDNDLRQYFPLRKGTLAGRCRLKVFERCIVVVQPIQIDIYPSGLRQIGLFVVDQHFE